MVLFKYLIAFLLIFSALFNFLAVWRARCFIRRQKRPLNSHLPKPAVTLLVPVCGVEGTGLEHFNRFCRLTWPNYQVLFCVLDPKDPAIPILQQVQAAQGCEISLQVGGNAEGENLKIRNLLNAVPLVKHDWLVICDADVIPDLDFLEGLMEPFFEGQSDEKIGMVHSLYRCRSDSTLAFSWENVWINCDFWTQGLLGDWLKGTDYAFGAAMAFRRSTLKEVGGLTVVRDHLADDYQLGNRIAKSGKQLLFNRNFVTLEGRAQSWGETWRHLLRWCRTIRVSQPLGFAGSIVMNMTVMALFALCVDFHLFLSASISTVLLRILFANQCRNWILGKNELWNRFWLIPFKDLAHGLLWALAFWNAPIEWRGKYFDLNSDGKLVPIKHS